MCKKFIFFIFILSLSSCGWPFLWLEEEKEELSDAEIIKCNKEREYREDLDTFLEDIDKMKVRARNYEVQGIYSYCLAAQFSYSRSYDVKLDVWRGEAYNVVRKVCDTIYKIYKSDITIEYDRKKNPDDAQVIQRSENIKKELLEVLDKAEKIAKDNIPEVEKRIKKICGSD